MKKVKFSIEIHSNGSYNDSLVRMITNHNEGKVTISFSTMVGHINAYYAQWPTISPITEVKSCYPANTLDIIEGGKHTLTITRKVLEELQPGIDECPTVFLNEGINNPETSEAIN